MASNPESGSISIAVRGLVAEPRVFTKVNLAELPQVTRTVTFLGRGAERTVTYTGPLLLDVIKAAGGVVEQQRLDRLRAYLVARSATGYEVVFSWGEIDALMGDGAFLIAHETDDTPYDGSARLVAPKDHHGGRYVGQLVDLEILSLPARPSA